jgi:hypothetical protein
MHRGSADGGASLRTLIRRIKEHGVMRNLVALSTHWLRSYAVEACVLKCPTPLDRELVAAAFAALRDNDLAEMVQDEYGSCVLQRFLQSAAEDVSATHFYAVRSRDCHLSANAPWFWTLVF